LVLNEVYEGDVQGFVERAETFFAQMPNSDEERQLSDHSPLRKQATEGNAQQGAPANASEPRR